MLLITTPSTIPIKWTNKSFSKTDGTYTTVGTETTESSETTDGYEGLPQ